MSKNTKNTTNATKTTKFTATQVAQWLAEAQTPSEKGTATRRLKAYVAQRVNEGADASRVEKNVRSLCNRLGRNG